MIRRNTLCTTERRVPTASLDDRARLTAFIAYFNDVLAHPYKWTYTGRPLRP